MAKAPGKKKNKNKKKDAKQEAPGQAEAAAVPASESAAAPSKRSKVGKAIKKTKSATSKLAESPLVTEVVAAALVATAAAIKDPAKARKMAASAGADLKHVGKKSSAKSEVFWKLALDVARRTLESLEDTKQQSSDPKPKR